MKGRVIGMVQTRPLPGSYRNRGERIDSITEQALEETRILAECGVQSVILQNMGDMPVRQQSAPEAIAYLSVVAQAIRRSFPRAVPWRARQLGRRGRAGCGGCRRSGLCARGASVHRCRGHKRRTAAGPVLRDHRTETEAGDGHSRLCRRLGAPRHPAVPPAAGRSGWQCVHEAFADGLFLCGKNAQESLSMARQVRRAFPAIRCSSAEAQRETTFASCCRNMTLSA